MKMVEAIQGLTADARHQFSSSVTQLNDSSAEYVIQTMKHFYDKYIIVQYGIRNTIDDQVLSKLSLKVNGLETDHNLQVKGIIPLAEGDSIRSGEKKFVYLILDRTQSTEAYPQAKIQSSLNYTITEIDVDTEEEVGSYEDDYDFDEA